MIVQSDVVASNGMIHVINKLMDSVAPTVESDTQVETCSVKYFTDETLMDVLSSICFVSSQENLMKIISDYGKFDKFKSLLEVCRSPGIFLPHLDSVRPVRY